MGLPEGQGAAARGNRSRARPAGDWLRVIRMRECYALVAARFFTDPVIYFVIFWLPEYLRRERGFDLAMIGKYAWVPFIFGDIGYVLGGWFSGHLMRRGWPLPRARRFVLLSGAAVMPIADHGALRLRSVDGHRAHLRDHLRPRSLDLQPADAAHGPVPRPARRHRHGALRHGRGGRGASSPTWGPATSYPASPTSPSSSSRA